MVSAVGRGGRVGPPWTEKVTSAGTVVCLGCSYLAGEGRVLDEEVKVVLWFAV